MTFRQKGDYCVRVLLHTRIAGIFQGGGEGDKIFVVFVDKKPTMKILPMKFRSVVYTVTQPRNFYHELAIILASTKIPPTKNTRYIMVPTCKPKVTTPSAKLISMHILSLKITNFFYYAITLLKDGKCTFISVTRSWKVSGFVNHTLLT